MSGAQEPLCFRYGSSQVLAAGTFNSSQNQVSCTIRTWLARGNRVEITAAILCHAVILIAVLDYPTSLVGPGSVGARIVQN